MLRSSISLLCLLLPGLAIQAQTCNPNGRATAPDERFQAHADGTVTDLATGLLWKQCEEGRQGADCHGTTREFSWQEALTHAQGVVFAGYKDWRLPNLKELQSLVELRCAQPAINVRRFPRTSSRLFWSSSPSMYYPNGYGWHVDFNYGDYDDDNRDFRFAVRLVRGGS